jgi:hypothetical protein
VRYFFYIGGNDSAETTHIINEEAKRAGFEMHCFHIPKTVDNDLRENDHTPGWASSAKFVAQAFMGDDLDNAALPGVKINVVMGRHAGFLTAAAALARTYPGAGPHLIYLPERPFDLRPFPQQSSRRREVRPLRRAVSEGVSDITGTAIAAAFTKKWTATATCSSRFRRPGRRPGQPDQDQDRHHPRARRHDRLSPALVSGRGFGQRRQGSLRGSAARRSAGHQRDVDGSVPSAARRARSTRSSSSAWNCAAWRRKPATSPTSSSRPTAATSRRLPRLREAHRRRPAQDRRFKRIKAKK